jgi:hypothetical protein
MSDSEQFQIKPIRRESVAHSLEMARRYRLLNEPMQAESICLDILALEPDNEAARVELVLTMSDQFAGTRKSPRRADIMAHIDLLSDEYSKHYYRGLVHEREGLGFLDRGHASTFAYDGLRDAMECYERAEKIRPAGNDDAILRWNACVRAIQREQLKPPVQYKHELPLD